MCRHNDCQLAAKRILKEDNSDSLSYLGDVRCQHNQPDVFKAPEPDPYLLAMRRKFRSQEPRPKAELEKPQDAGKDTEG